MAKKSGVETKKKQVQKGEAQVVTEWATTNEVTPTFSRLMSILLRGKSGNNQKE